LRFLTALQNLEDKNTTQSYLAILIRKKEERKRVTFRTSKMKYISLQEKKEIRYGPEETLQERGRCDMHQVKYAASR